MKEKGLSQEGLKLLACLTMLLDHIGATLVPGWTLRIIGRLAFPIFCFLLAEGAHYTKNPAKYAFRLAIGAILSEIPFDFALFGGWTWYYQSVMLTMLLGFGALFAMGNCQNGLWKCLIVLPFALTAEWLQTDYGGAGVLLIAMFGLTRKVPHRNFVQTIAMGVLIWFLMPGAPVPVLGREIPIELFGVLAMVPVALYSGKKRTHKKAAQWAFYLFYPVHLGVLYLIRVL